MSVERYGPKWRVRWYTSTGKHPSRTFSTREDAEAFDAKVQRRREVQRGSAVLNLLDHTRTGKVYVVHGADKVKIGISLDVDSRFADLQAQGPTPLRMVWRIATPNAAQLERALHRRYAKYRTHGEWFEAAPVLADLAGLADLGVYRFEGVRQQVKKIPNDSYGPVDSKGRPW